MHRFIRWSVGAAIALAIARGTMNAPSVASAHPSDKARDVAAAARSDKDRNLYQVTPLVSDGSTDAPFHDANLLNSWGIARGVSGPFWVADNHADVATLYDGNGVANPLVVSLPAGTGPTGIVFNPGGGFIVNDGTNSGPARFLFATEDGRIFGWNPGVPAPSPSRTAFQLNLDSIVPVIYKGIALASTAGGQRLYATDFHNRVVDVFDEALQPVRLGPEAFVDPDIPGDFAPFGIQNIQGRILVTYAKQDEEAEDDVRGQGFGFVDAFDTDGVLLGRIATRGPLDSPWGLTLAPQSFGRFGGDLLVGNFGGGRIQAYRLTDDFRSATHDGTLRGADHRPIVVPSLWGLVFGNDQGAGTSDTLFFTSGPGDEEHGLFGKIEAR